MSGGSERIDRATKTSKTSDIFLRQWYRIVLRPMLKRLRQRGVEINVAALRRMAKGEGEKMSGGSDLTREAYQRGVPRGLPTATEAYGIPYWLGQSQFVEVSMNEFLSVLKQRRKGALKAMWLEYVRPCFEIWGDRPFARVPCRSERFAGSLKSIIAEIWWRLTAAVGVLVKGAKSAYDWE